MTTIKELKAKSNDELLAHGCRWWDGKLMLIPLTMLNTIADGEALVCIDGTTSVKGVDKIDDDTRGGLLAYGFLSANPRMTKKEASNA